MQLPMPELTRSWPLQLLEGCASSLVAIGCAYALRAQLESHYALIMSVCTAIFAAAPIPSLVLLHAYRHHAKQLPAGSPLWCVRV